MTAQATFALVSPVGPTPHWRVDESDGVNKSHPALLRLADLHYTRQTVGAPMFTRPGVNLCLLLSDGSAGWVTWRPIPQVGRMDRLECWECTFFANRGGRLSSTLIREATDITYRKWGWTPRDGFITAVGIEQTRKRRSKQSPPGKCYLAAGWQPIEIIVPKNETPTVRDVEAPIERDGKAWFRAPDPKSNAAAMVAE